MLLEQPKQIVWILVYDNILARDVNAEAVRGEVLSVLLAWASAAGAKAAVTRPHTLSNKVLSSVDTFFSVASAKLISITSAIWLPSLSTKLALKDPRSVARSGATSCCVWVRSMSSLLCRFDGGGNTVAIFGAVAVSGLRLGWSGLFRSPLVRVGKFWR